MTSQQKHDRGGGAAPGGAIAHPTVAAAGLARRPRRSPEVESRVRPAHAQQHDTSDSVPGQGAWQPPRDTVSLSPPEQGLQPGLLPACSPADSDAPLLLLREWHSVLDIPGLRNRGDSRGESRDASRHPQQQQQQQQQQAGAARAAQPQVPRESLAPGSAPAAGRQAQPQPAPTHYAWQRGGSGALPNPPPPAATAAKAADPAVQQPATARAGSSPADGLAAQPPVRRSQDPQLPWMTPPLFPSPLQPELLRLPSPSSAGLSVAPLSNQAPLLRPPVSGSYLPLPPRQYPAAGSDAAAAHPQQSLFRSAVAYPPAQPWQSHAYGGAAAGYLPHQYRLNADPGDVVAVPPQPAGPAVTAVSVAVPPRWQEAAAGPQPQEDEQAHGPSRTAQQAQQGQGGTATAAAPACLPSVPLPSSPAGLPPTKPGGAGLSRDSRSLLPAAEGSSGGSLPRKRSGSGGRGSSGRTGGRTGGTGGSGSGSGRVDAGAALRLQPAAGYVPLAAQRPPHSRGESPANSPTHLLLLQEQQLQLQLLQQQQQLERQHQQQMEQLKRQHQLQLIAAQRQHAAQQAQQAQLAQQAQQAKQAKQAQQALQVQQAQPSAAAGAAGGLSGLFSGPQFSDSQLFAGLSNMSLPTFVRQAGDVLGLCQAGEVVQSPRQQQLQASFPSFATTATGAAEEGEEGQPPLPAGQRAGLPAGQHGRQPWGQPAASVASGSQLLLHTTQRRHSGSPMLQQASPHIHTGMGAQRQQQQPSAAAAAATAAMAPPPPRAAVPMRGPEQQQQKHRLYNASTVAGRWAQKAVRADWADIQRKRHFQEAAAAAETQRAPAAAMAAAAPVLGAGGPRRGAPLARAQAPSSTSSSEEEDGLEEEEQSVSEWQQEEAPRRRGGWQRRPVSGGRGAHTSATKRTQQQQLQQLQQQRLLHQGGGAPRLQKLRGRPPKDPVAAAAWRQHQAEAEAAAAAERLAMRRAPTAAAAAGAWRIPSQQPAADTAAAAAFRHLGPQQQHYVQQQAAAAPAPASPAVPAPAASPASPGAGVATAADGQAPRRSSRATKGLHSGLGLYELQHGVAEDGGKAGRGYHRAHGNSPVSRHDQQQQREVQAEEEEEEGEEQEEGARQAKRRRLLLLRPRSRDTDQQEWSVLLRPHSVDGKSPSLLAGSALTASEVAQPAAAGGLPESPEVLQQAQQAPQQHAQQAQQQAPQQQAQQQQTQHAQPAQQQAQQHAQDQQPLQVQQQAQQAGQSEEVSLESGTEDEEAGGTPWGAAELAALRAAAAQAALEAFRPVPPAGLTPPATADPPLRGEVQLSARPPELLGAAAPSRTAASAQPRTTLPAECAPLGSWSIVPAAEPSSSSGTRSVGQAGREQQSCSAAAAAVVQASAGPAKGQPRGSSAGTAAGDPAVPQELPVVLQRDPAQPAADAGNHEPARVQQAVAMVTPPAQPAAGGAVCAEVQPSAQAQLVLLGQPTLAVQQQQQQLEAKPQQSKGHQVQPEQQQQDEEQPAKRQRSALPDCQPAVSAPQATVGQQPQMPASRAASDTAGDEEEQRRQLEFAEQRAEQIRTYCRAPSPPSVGITASAGAREDHAVQRGVGHGGVQASAEVSSGNGEGGGGTAPARSAPCGPSAVALRLMINAGSLNPAAATGPASLNVHAGQWHGGAAQTPAHAAAPEDVQSCMVNQQVQHGSAAAAQMALLQQLLGGVSGASPQEMIQGLQALLERERAQKEAALRQLNAFQQQQQQGSSQQLPRSSEGTQHGPAPAQQYQQLKPHQDVAPSHVQQLQQQQQVSQGQSLQAGPSSGGGGAGDATVLPVHSLPAKAVHLTPAQQQLQQQQQQQQQQHGFQQQPVLPLDQSAGTLPERSRKQRSGGLGEGVPAAVATHYPPSQHRYKNHRFSSSGGRRRPQQQGGCGSGSAGSAGTTSWQLPGMASTAAAAGSMQPRSAEPRQQQRRPASTPTIGGGGRTSGQSSFRAGEFAGRLAAAAAAAVAAGVAAEGSRDSAAASDVQSDLAGCGSSPAAAAVAAEAEAQVQLPPEPGPEPEAPFVGAARSMPLREWRRHKAALQQWQQRKRRRDEAEELAAELALPPGKRRAAARRRASLPPGAIAPQPPLRLPPPSAATLMLQQQHEALVAAQGGRSGLRRAAAVTGAAKLAARAAEEGGPGEEEQLQQVDMASLRRSAPLIKQHKSATHGWGMFAGTPIQRGSFVVEYVGEVVSNAVADRRERQYEASGDGTMYFFRLDSQQVIDATRKGNAARHINHSCAPNCFTRVMLDMHTRRKSMAIFALRDIAADEELTYHYMFEEEPDAEPLPCNCGAANCAGRMN